MFDALISDRVGADMVMIGALTLYLAGQIITVHEALIGFSNEGLLSVLALFVVAEGISKTGALDWYMGKLLGRPTATSAAQLRLMVPISIVSAFLNNTPVVAVMIPIVQKWSASIGMSAQQLLIPLSFASILGGTCTLIVTSTNLVVAGLLAEAYLDDPKYRIGLFDLSLYGVPIAMIGMVYILLASPCLLPGGAGCRSNNNRSGAVNIMDGDNDGGGDGMDGDLLLGAQFMLGSPVAGRSIKRSGLRDAAGGVYLVSVHRAATGDIHRAVGPDFVLSVGDVLYFTGLVEGFGAFCEEHGMKVLTADMMHDDDDKDDDRHHNQHDVEQENDASEEHFSTLQLPSISEDFETGTSLESQEDFGTKTTRESVMRVERTERLREISEMVDMIRGTTRHVPTKEEGRIIRRSLMGNDTRRSSILGRGPKRVINRPGAYKVAVAIDEGAVIVGVDARDRHGLLLDISKGLVRLNLTLHHSEASTINDRSISIWRCEVADENKKSSSPDEIQSVLNAMLESNTRGSILVPKTEGAEVVRAVITQASRLNDVCVRDVDFWNQYRAAFIAIKRGGRDVPLKGAVLQAGDILILKANDNSSLLRQPPTDFYTPKISEKITSSELLKSIKNKATNIIGMKGKNNITEECILPDGKRSLDIEAAAICSGEDIDLTSDTIAKNEEIWRDLRELFLDRSKERSDEAREFLIGMEVAPKSKLANRTVDETGFNKQTGVFLVSIDRPMKGITAAESRISRRVSAEVMKGVRKSTLLDTYDPEKGVTSFRTISNEEALQVDDVLWFAGGAQSVGDLRKIPGLVSHLEDDVKQILEHVHDRRLVEAVIARRGPLVGQTAISAQFRERYGAVCIAVHRDGSRIHDNPSKVVLRAGDVLLLEAGPTFIIGSHDHDKSFSLFAEVKDSTPPRLELLSPALLITIAMLGFYTADLVELITCALFAGMLMIMFGILSEQEARDAINWDIFITIGSAFGIGTALVNSGVAGGLANFLVKIRTSGPFANGSAGVFAAVYFATFLISNVVTNNAAAALLFPIDMGAAEQTGTDPVLMSYCLMLGASASFMSPFGYQTNMMVYQPGGYVYNDFLFLGSPMQLVLWIVSVALLVFTTGSNFYISWFVSFLILVLVAFYGIAMEYFKNKIQSRRNDVPTEV